MAGGVLAVGGLQEAKAGQQEEQGVLDGWITSYRGLHHVRGHQREDVSYILITISFRWSRHGLQTAAKGGGFMAWGDFTAGGGACSEPSCCGGCLCGEGSDLGIHHAGESQEVTELRKAYSNMYNFLTQMRSSGSSSSAMPDMPPPPPPPSPPPPPARSQSPPPWPDQGTSFPQPEDDPDYV
ncbi:hypothetical protein PIB30_082666 [Stylosanthes scabra]|uniref:Uncharacterized protein n=1 Tax=Stylosanthes scabra TaxID=79078 RepID=A0ABU6QS43_9FABA|nr:hypothetical protein [Stylosanthes scabra]